MVLHPKSINKIKRISLKTPMMLSGGVSCPTWGAWVVNSLKIEVTSLRLNKQTEIGKMNLSAKKLAY
jgi:hypothetical protein